MKIFNSKILKKNFLSPLLLIAFFTSLIFSSQNSYALSPGYGPDRIRTCSDNSLVFDPANGHDVLFVLDNPVCQAIILGSYASVKVSIAAMNTACSSGSSIPRALPSPFRDAIDFANASKKTALQSCNTAYWTAYGFYSTFLLAISTVYETATIAFDKASVCGSNWLKPNDTTFDMSSPDYKQSVEDTIKGYIDNDPSQLTLGNQVYREWYYGGVEVRDNPDYGPTCLDVTQPKSGGSYPAQRYYMKGTQAGNFNCNQYNPAIFDFEIDNPPTQKEVSTAYGCCRKRSAQYLCINTSDGITRTKTFCQSGKRCTIKGITYSIAPIDDGRMLCAESYSVCPYNFSLEGGSKRCDYYKDGIWNQSQGRYIMITIDDIEKGNCSSNSEIRNEDCTYNAKAGQCKNYCQYLKHCTVTGDNTFVYSSNLSSPYFSRACFDFVGDSRNDLSFDTAVVGTQRHFSAPIAQCMKETLENVFYDTVGHSRCLTGSEVPSSTGICLSGQYINDTFEYKKGNHTMSNSFFSSLQNNLQVAVKLVITLSIMFYGMKILLGGGALSKKEILMYLLKIGLVLYFATGTAWQGVFFKGVYGSAAELSKIVFKIEVGSQENKRDGCQFGDMTFVDGTSIVVNSAAKPYPEGKEYLAIWDTLDCKIARYLGFGPQASDANIASLFFAALITGVYGIYFAIAIMFFGLYLIITTIKALHIFLSSAISIIIMVYISPLIIPTILFKKTEHIFKKWVENLIGFCLQPMILFAYIAIFITVLDKTVIGSATFHGSGPVKTISCSKVCEDLAGNVVDSPACDQVGETLIDPMNDSVACLISADKFGKFPGFEIIGVSIPIIKNLFTGDVKAKILTMVKGAFVMFVLCQFMDQITGIAAGLVGGAEMKSGAGNAMFVRALHKAKGFAKGATERIQGGVSQAMKKGEGTARGAAAYANKHSGGGNSSDDGAKEDKVGGGSGDGKGESGGGNVEVGADGSHSSSFSSSTSASAGNTRGANASASSNGGSSSSSSSGGSISSSSSSSSSSGTGDNTPASSSSFKGSGDDKGGSGGGSGGGNVEVGADGSRSSSFSSSTSASASSTKGANASASS